MKPTPDYFSEDDLYNICITAIENNMTFRERAESMFRTGSSLRTSSIIAALIVVDRIKVLTAAANEIVDILMQEGRIKPLSNAELAPIIYATSLDSFVTGFKRHVPGIMCRVVSTDIGQSYCPN
ncbi:MAG TPA: hypothetical protein PKW15_04485 [Alphaproteobacteria bacterium]|nr:hypothetical protein [Alphaproteobacteria bacterium]